MLSTSASSVSYRQKGKLPSANSKLYKGFVHDASSKLSIASIPAKMELVIYKDQSIKAFGSSEARFKNKLDDVPGPQDYEASTVGQSRIESISKLGLGGLANKQERTVFEQKYINTGPGPGQYNQNLSFNTDYQPSFFMRSQSSQPVEKIQIINPGPGEYDGKLPDKKSCIKSVFISKSLRGQYLKKPNYPPPGQYEVIKEKKFEGPTSSFIPDSQSQKEKSAQQQIMQMLTSDNKLLQEQSPGPGEYDTKFPTFDPDYIQNKQLSSFMPTKIERFSLPKETLGPGVYEKQSEFDQIVKDKDIVTHAVFTSITMRKPFGDFEDKLGPNTKIPYILPKKKNFHLNLQRKWI